MSKITTIHDGIISLVSSTLPSTYQQLPNPYRPEFNNERYLTKGFGVAVGGSERTDRIVSCQSSWERRFQIILTNQITSTDHNIVSRETITKSLLEDHFLLVQAIEKDVSLSSSTINFRIESDAGIEFLEVGERGRYFVIVIEVLAEYLEDLT